MGEVLDIELSNQAFSLCSSLLGYNPIFDFIVAFGIIIFIAIADKFRPIYCRQSSLATYRSLC